MEPISLHPLARQAVIASSNRACAGWAHGLTQYLTAADPFSANPFACVEWTLNFLLPFSEDDGKVDDVVRRSTCVLQQILADPSSAVLADVESAAWAAWHARTETKNGNVVARLLWAAMGAVEFARPSWMQGSDLAERGDSSVDFQTRAKGIVWDQSAMALQVRAHDKPATTISAAIFFTNTTTFATAPSADREGGRFEWQWQELRYEIHVRRSHEGTHYLEYIDPLGDRPLFSGPFASRFEMDAVFSLLSFTPKTIRITRVS